MKPAFTDLRHSHETVEKLKRALKGMDKPTLEALVLNGVFPEVCVCVCVCVVLVKGGGSSSSGVFGT